MFLLTDQKDNSAPASRPMLAPLWMAFVCAVLFVVNSMVEFAPPVGWVVSIAAALSFGMLFFLLIFQRQPQPQPVLSSPVYKEPVAVNGPTAIYQIPSTDASTRLAHQTVLHNGPCAIKRTTFPTSPIKLQEEHFRILFEQGPVITYRCEWDNGPKVFYITPNVEQILGFTAEEMTQHPTFGAFQCHPDDIGPLWYLLQTSLETGSGQMEHRMRHKDGTYRWLLSQWRFLPNSNEYVGHLQDITKRKEMESELMQSRIELRKLATRLNTVHEEERARMAREVHDVLGQNLTVLKFGLEQLAYQVDGQVEQKVNQLLGVVEETVEHVQRLSTQLRPCMLDDLGLIAALEWLVCEFTWRTELTVELELPDEIPPIEDNLSLVLYRILQEALTNIVRHAEATEIRVALQVTSDKIMLLIQDNGHGFNPNQPRQKKSLGLIGMNERIAPWDGTVQIDSSPGRGTTVSVEALLSPS